MSNEDEVILEAVNRYLDAYAQRSVEDCMQHMATTSPVMLFGTNADEVFTSIDAVRAAFARDFAGMADIRWGEPRHVDVRAGSELASVLLELPIAYRSEGEEVATLFRFALTLIREAGHWKICTGLASVPFPADTYSFSA